MKALLALLIVLSSSPALAGELEERVAEAVEIAGMDAADYGPVSDPDWFGRLGPESFAALPQHVLAWRKDPLGVLNAADQLERAAQLANDDPASAASLLFGVAIVQPRHPGLRGLAESPPLAPEGPGVLDALLRQLERGSPLVACKQQPSRPRPGRIERRLGAQDSAQLADLLCTLIEVDLRIRRSWRGLPAGQLQALGTAFAKPAGELDLAMESTAAIDLLELGNDRERAASARLLLAAVERFLDTPWQPQLDSAITLDTTLGRIWIGSSKSDEIDCKKGCLLVLDPAGDDRHRGSARAVAPTQSVALSLDLGGNDRWEGGAGSTFGGVAIATDLAGDDDYVGVGAAQAAALGGYALLIDGAGNDSYVADHLAQASAALGGAMLLDFSGDDHYRLTIEGQAFAGAGGSAALIDLKGDDVYLAEPTPDEGELGDPHVDGRVRASNAQAAARGARGLMSGQPIAGGLALLLDADGNDRYRAGTFAQGHGYAAGSAVLLDLSGHDIYEAAYFAQGSAAHHGIGALIDRLGNDAFLLFDRAGASLGYAWDDSLGIFLDGAGEDVYRCRETCLGGAERSSVGLFLEAGGCDRYEIPKTARAPGMVDHFALRPPRRQLGLFLDLAGADTWSEGYREHPGRFWREQAGPAFGSSGLAMDLEVHD